jgi:hypothetical protein
MRAALILALVIPGLAAPAGPQTAGSAPPDAAPRGATQEVKSSGVIRGRITSLDTGKPLRRAQVSLREEATITPRTASTSNDGRYEFRDIPPGRYTLRVQRSGYLALNYGQRHPGEQARPLEIADKAVVEKVDFALPRMSIISGRVLDELGEPIVGVTVWALQGLRLCSHLLSRNVDGGGGAARSRLASARKRQPSISVWCRAGPRG